MAGQKDCKKCTSCRNLLSLFVVLAALFPVWRTLRAGDPLSHMYVNLLLFTPYRDQVKQLWKDTLVFPEGVQRSMHHVPIINKEDYSLCWPPLLF
jgi:hypothetical protein